MDFTFSAEQDELRASVRAVLADAVAGGVVRRAVDGDRSGVDDWWKTIADLGWRGMLVPEAHGGLGLGLVDAVVVLEELGRVAFPGPFLSSAVVAPAAAAVLEELTLLDAPGRGVVAVEEAGDGDPVDRIRTFASRKGATWRLTGTVPVVLDGVGAAWVLVPARTQEGLRTFLLEEPELVPISMLDPTRAAGRLALDATPARPVGPAGDHAARWRRIVDVGAVAVAAELIGTCEASLAMAVNYGQQRVQFDVPIASHQVIQHKYVDMLHRLELGRVGVHRAAWAHDAGDDGFPTSAAIAKSAMGAAAVAVTGETIQIHGAVGFTWECDAHLHFKRAKQNDLLFGSRSWHRRRIADSVLQ